jgi:hypothetical protein
MRPDPIQPVAEVEQIFALCVAVSPILAFLAGLALAAAALAPLARSSPAGHPARDAAVALSAYFVTVSVAPFIGWFPVPLVGLGMSFPVGWWLGMGLLPVIARRARWPGQPGLTLLAIERIRAMASTSFRDDQLIPSALLRAIEGRVGMLQEARGILSDRGDGGPNADADGDHVFAGTSWMFKPPRRAMRRM